ncbi:hypothetical protein [Nocardia sp. CS682]|uniref:hypothetical protein n=1 Tax=Nocardia sp. CS682 TaxID=1047172 RepID=UPI001074BDA0|nr:hypothetical protein [Nocardia sp. CS682]QBS39949.1 hypothetical protein DMB37_07175 [Nocardia sp. CS682]
MTILDRPGTSVRWKAVGGDGAPLLRRACAAGDFDGAQFIDRPNNQSLRYPNYGAAVVGVAGTTPAWPKTARDLHFRGDAPRPQRERWSMTARCKISLTGRGVEAGFGQDAVGFAESEAAGFVRGGSTGFARGGVGAFAQGAAVEFAQGAAVEFAQGAVIA